MAEMMDDSQFEDLDQDTNPREVRALVVEDETLIRLDIVETLREAGFNIVAEGSNGEEAIALAAEHEPDLIVMDVKMPGLDGVSAAERILASQRCAIVMLTAFSQKRLLIVPVMPAPWHSWLSHSAQPICFLQWKSRYHGTKKSFHLKRK